MSWDADSSQRRFDLRVGRLGDVRWNGFKVDTSQISGFASTDLPVYTEGYVLSIGSLGATVTGHWSSFFQDE